jgi:hypothetical protein
MYRNSGASIKGLARFFCFVGILISVGVAKWAYRLTMSSLVAVVVFAIAALLSWISFIVLYGFGEIVE